MSHKVNSFMLHIKKKLSKEEKSIYVLQSINFFNSIRMNFFTKIKISNRDDLHWSALDDLKIE